MSGICFHLKKIIQILQDSKSLCDIMSFSTVDFAMQSS